MQQNNREYYKEVKKKAYEIRNKYELKGPRILPSTIIKILKEEGVRAVVKWQDFKKLRGAYLIESDGTPVVAVNSSLPRDPMAFTLAHELKHHLMDQELGRIVCSNSNIDKTVEVGAEIFAAELIYPEQLYLTDLLHLGVGKDNISAIDIIKLKRSNDTTLSHQALAKRAMNLRLAAEGSLTNVKWQKLSEEIFGVPEYKKFIRRKKNTA
ncbi:ImmA/IrrE family metallo-endopeptidase [Leptospira kmetyi]|uniref:ImmA/IrrE family metallo-endopeptidase n=1 Tax=Leptospira kmetyi TaxID=408139 RepID=UPI001083D554|nr:ImmA/IrrE family metallo-endopeptidase [Leptospira kmetyi]TGK23375.1 ImmA/IrrE family metallo-endopeptidase [Leptospira kmetyi]TGK34407.1 ImmA/IrrE family metallo-endopeptidase [Leptospira kmetyi]